MTFLKTLWMTAALGAAVAAAGPAAAITYVGSRDVGIGSVELSVTTDDTLGVLGADNILDWTLHITNGVDSQDLFGPLSGDNSVFQMLGTALSASATELLFDFDGQGVLVFADAFGPAVRAYCVDGGTAFGSRCLSEPSGSEQIVFGVPNPANIKVLTTGVGVLGTVASVSVPEPAAWSLMIAGFGLAGGGLRRRRAARAAAA